MARQRFKSSCEKCKNEMKTERLRSKHATTRRRLRFLFVNKRQPCYSLEFKLRTLLSWLSYEANSMLWLMVPRLLLPREPRLTLTLTLVLTVLVVKTKATGLK